MVSGKATRIDAREFVDQVAIVEPDEGPELGARGRGPGLKRPQRLIAAQLKCHCHRSKH